MAALSYVQKKGYIKEYEEAEREAGLEVYERQVCEDLYLAAAEPPPGAVSPEFQACQEAVTKVNEKNLA